MPHCGEYWLYQNQQVDNTIISSAARKALQMGITRVITIEPMVPPHISTLFMAAWQRVDYRMKQMQPWKQLAEEPAHASCNLLIDYVSPSLSEGVGFFCEKKTFRRDHVGASRT